jgi:hypothetical protein
MYFSILRTNRSLPDSVVKRVPKPRKYSKIMKIRKAKEANQVHQNNMHQVFCKIQKQIKRKPPYVA